jgi:hypothetical protein
MEQPRAKHFVPFAAEEAQPRRRSIALPAPRGGPASGNYDRTYHRQFIVLVSRGATPTSPFARRSPCGRTSWVVALRRSQRCPTRAPHIWRIVPPSGSRQLCRSSHRLPCRLAVSPAGRGAGRHGGCRATLLSRRPGPGAFALVCTARGDASVRVVVASPRPQTRGQDPGGAGFSCAPSGRAAPADRGPSLQ